METPYFQADQSFLGITNKTFVFFNGKNVAHYRKRILSRTDFERYDGLEKGLRIYSPGIFGKEQKKNPGFFQLFGLQIWNSE